MFVQKKGYFQRGKSPAEMTVSYRCENCKHLYYFPSHVYWVNLLVPVSGVKDRVSLKGLFASLAVLGPRVDHTTDVLSPFIPVLCHSVWLFDGESCPRLDVVHPGRTWSLGFRVMVPGINRQPCIGEDKGKGRPMKLHNTGARTSSKRH